MVASTDLYKTLGVSKSASKDEIRKAYKRLARQHHPDANADDPNALEKFKEIQRAWDVLGDEQKRENYDKYGSPDGPAVHGGQSQAGTGRTWSWSSSAGDEVPFDMEELFSGFRTAGGGPFGPGGHGQQRTWPVRGHDIRTEVTIPFQLAAEGGKYDLHLNRGSGEIDTLTVSIPPGVDSGSVIRLARQGTPGSNGGEAGDLLVTMNVAPHAWFRREGLNLLLDVPLSITECALGTKVDIPTLSDGVMTLTIPPGSSGGSRLRLRGKGVRDRTGRRGDLLAVLKVTAPSELNDRSRQLLRELDQSLNHNPRDGLWS